MSHDAGKRNLELLGIASQDQQGKSVSVQQTDGSFAKVTPTEAKRVQEAENNQTQLQRALHAFNEREKLFKQEMELLHLGGCDPRGTEALKKIMGRRQ